MLTLLSIMNFLCAAIICLYIIFLCSSFKEISYTKIFGMISFNIGIIAFSIYLISTRITTYFIIGIIISGILSMLSIISNENVKKSNKIHINDTMLYLTTIFTLFFWANSLVYYVFIIINKNEILEVISDTNSQGGKND